MAYIDKGSAQTGQSVEVDIRGKREGATVVNLPFYHRSA
jgi:glycine cleavage system aminomethyltransferase T